MRRTNRTNLFIIGLVFLVQLVHAHSMNMDMSSPYGTICMNLLGTNYKFPGADCTASYRKAMCYCGNSDYVESVVGCIDRFIELEEPESMADHIKHDAYHSFTSMCSNVTMSELQDHENKSSSLPTYYGGDSGKRPGQWPVKSAFRPTDDELRQALKAYTIYNGHEPVNKRFGSALVAYWGAVIAIKSFIHFCTKLFPLAPLTLGNTHIGRFVRKHFQIRCYKLTSSTPSQILIIAGFIILTILLTFLDTHYTSQYYDFQYSNTAVYGYLLGMRTGVYIMYLMPLFFLFAGRNNFLQYITGWPQEPFLLFHRWIARVEVVLVLVHALGYTAQRVPLNYYGAMWSEAYWNWGIVGLALGGFILIQSMKYIRRLHYELFLVLHIIAAVIFVVASWYHIKLLEYDNFLNALYTSFAVWGFDRVVRLCRILYCGPKKCRVTLEGNMLVLTLDKPKWWPLAIVPGTYIFVHFLMPLQFWQSHPLTLTSSPSDPTKIKLYFRVFKGISKTLAEKIEKSGESSLEMSILLDGPYGCSYDFLEYDECLFIAGGSGITVPLAYIYNSLLRMPSRESQKTTLCWAVNDPDVLSTFRDELLFLQNEAQVNIRIYVSPKNSEKEILEKLDEDTDELKGGSYSIYPQRLDIDQTIEAMTTKIKGNLSVMCCGPTGLHVATRNAVCNNMNKTKYYMQYFEEAYTW